MPITYPCLIISKIFIANQFKSIIKYTISYKLNPSINKSYPNIQQQNYTPLSHFSCLHVFDPFYLILGCMASITIFKSYNLNIRLKE